MRFVEIVGGFQVPISVEEHLLLGKIEESGSIVEGSLEPRQNEVARSLLIRGILTRVKKAEETHLAPNLDPNLWRF